MEKDDPLIGQIIFDKYEILEILGEGGVGVVYKARQIHIDRIVAVKTLKLQDPLLQQQFDVEVRVCSALQHPNVVVAFDTCMSAEGQPFFIMDYLDGVSLKELLKIKKSLTMAEIDEIFLQICDALDYTHKHGVTHRDLKPGNVMLIPQDGGHFEVKLVDFGLAQVARESDTEFLGGILGSPLYMSPEQCAGTRLDPKTDMYSLGVMLFEAITGDVPFLGATAEETMEMHEMAHPPRFADLNPEVSVPEAMEIITMKLLEKKPWDRYESMYDVLEAIRLRNPVGAPKKTGQSRSMGWKSGSAHSARPATGAHLKPPPELIPKPLPKAPPPPPPGLGAPAMIAIAAVVLVVIGAVAYFLLSNKPSQQPQTPAPVVQTPPPQAVPEPVKEPAPQAAEASQSQPSKPQPPAGMQPRKKKRTQ